MSEPRYPNESTEYRHARDSLLKEEQELVDKVKSVAEKRRNLPVGGQLKEDYTFQWANDGRVGKSVKFSELFADKNTLLLYSFMFGPNWDKPCLGQFRNVLRRVLATRGGEVFGSASIKLHRPRQSEPSGRRRLSGSLAAPSCARRRHGKQGILQAHRTGLLAAARPPSGGRLR
jgi:Bacterial protein of unknown function (DUF899)